MVSVFLQGISQRKGHHVLILVNQRMQPVALGIRGHEVMVFQHTVLLVQLIDKCRFQFRACQSLALPPLGMKARVIQHVLIQLECPVRALLLLPLRGIGQQEEEFHLVDVPLTGSRQLLRLIRLLPFPPLVRAVHYIVRLPVVFTNGIRHS